MHTTQKSTKILKVFWIIRLDSGWRFKDHISIRFTLDPRFTVQCRKNVSHCLWWQQLKLIKIKLKGLVQYYIPDMPLSRLYLYFKGLDQFLFWKIWNHLIPFMIRIMTLNFSFTFSYFLITIVSNAQPNWFMIIINTAYIFFKFPA